jgi:probable addiction module antidote protein
MSKTKVSRWDAVEVLETQEDIDLYLKYAFEDGDPRQITKALGNAARAQGILGISKKTGLAREHLYNSLSENGNPTLNTLTAVIDTLGYKLVIEPKSDRSNKETPISETYQDKRAVATS